MGRKIVHFLLILKVYSCEIIVARPFVKLVHVLFFSKLGTCMSITKGLVSIVFWKTILFLIGNQLETKCHMPKSAKK